MMQPSRETRWLFFVVSGMALLRPPSHETRSRLLVRYCHSSAAKAGIPRGGVCIHFGLSAPPVPCFIAGNRGRKGNGDDRQQRGAGPSLKGSDRCIRGVQPVEGAAGLHRRSEARRGGKECVSTGRTRGS